MNPTALPLQRGEHPQSLPYNFDEASRHAACRSLTAITLTEPSDRALTESVRSPGKTAPTKPRTKTTRPTTRQAEWERQARVTEIHGWLDNLHLRYENYIARNGDRPPILPSSGSGTSIEHTVTVKAARPVTKKTKGAPKKVVPNRLKPYLKHFMFPRDALERLPMFDDIVTGAVKDSGGNTRPLSKTMMVSLLQGLDEIAAEVIQKDARLSLRHAQRIAMCLRVIERAAFKVAETHWYLPSETDWSGLD